MPEVIARPESDPDYNPTARYDEPDECPNTNVPAHRRNPLVELYPVLTWSASPWTALVINAGEIAAINREAALEDGN
jgi:hypothetical protein